LAYDFILATYLVLHLYWGVMLLKRELFVIMLMLKDVIDTHEWSYYWITQSLRFQNFFFDLVFGCPFFFSFSSSRLIFRKLLRGITGGGLYVGSNGSVSSTGSPSSDPSLSFSSSSSSSDCSPEG